MAVAGNLVVNLMTNTKQYRSGLTSAQGMASSFVGKLTRILAPVAAALGAGVSIQAARTQEQAEKKLAAVLKATGGAAGLSAREIMNYAGELQSLTNFGDEATINAAAMLATFKDIKGDHFKGALAAAQDLSAVMDQDLKSSVVMLGKALNDPTLGLTAMQRVGIQFTNQQKDQIKAMHASGDMMGAQAIILKELQSQFGGAAKGMADPFTQAKNVLGDIAETVGFFLLPIINSAGKAFMAMFGPLTGARQTMQRLGETIGGVLSEGIQWAIGFVQANWGIIKTVGKFIGMVGGAAGIIAGLAVMAPALGAALLAAFTLATGPIGLVVAGVVALGAAFIQLTGEGETFGAKITDVFSKIPDLIDGLMFTFRNFGAIAQIAMIDIVQFALSQFPQMEKPLTDLAAHFVGTFAGIKAFFVSWKDSILGGLQEIGNFMKALGAGAAAVFRSIGQGSFKGLGGKFMDAFTSELASQTDVKGGGNPFAKFGEAYSKASSEFTQSMTRGGGLSQVLADQKDSLLAGIADREASLESVTAKTAAATAAQGPAAGPDIQSQGQKLEQKLTATEWGTKEAMQAIVASVKSSKKSTEEKTEKHTEKTAKAVQAAVVELKKITDNTGGDEIADF